MTVYTCIALVEVTSGCNLKCPMCYTISAEFRKHVNAKIMDFDMFKRIIDEELELKKARQ